MIGSLPPRFVDVRRLGEGSEGGAWVARDADAREKGIRAVPTFLIAGRHVVPGAQPVALWLSVIDELAGAKVDPAQDRIDPQDGPAC